MRSRELVPPVSGAGERPGAGLLLPQPTTRHSFLFLIFHLKPSPHTRMILSERATACALFGLIAGAQAATVYLAGDSTMANGGGGNGTKGKHPICSDSELC